MKKYSLNININYTVEPSIVTFCR